MRSTNVWNPTSSTSNDVGPAASSAEPGSGKRSPPSQSLMSLIRSYSFSSDSGSGIGTNTIVSTVMFLSKSFWLVPKSVWLVTRPTRRVRAEPPAARQSREIGFPSDSNTSSLGQLTVTDLPP